MDARKQRVSTYESAKRGNRLKQKLDEKSRVFAPVCNGEAAGAIPPSPSIGILQLAGIGCRFILLYEVQYALGGALVINL